MRLIAIALALALASSTGEASAQIATFIDSASRKQVPVETARPLPTIGKQESFQLVAANVPSAAVTLAGGDYVLDQACASYGTVTFARLGPDASTYFTMGTYNASDIGNAHLFKFGSYAKVKVTVSGTTGCNVLIARVPA